MMSLKIWLQLGLKSDRADFIEASGTYFRKSKAFYICLNTEFFFTNNATNKYVFSLFKLLVLIQKASQQTHTMLFRSCFILDSDISSLEPSYLIVIEKPVYFN